MHERGLDISRGLVTIMFREGTYVQMTVEEAAGVRDDLNFATARGQLPEVLSRVFRRGNGTVVARVRGNGTIEFSEVDGVPGREAGRFMEWLAAHEKEGTFDGKAES